MFLFGIFHSSEKYSFFCNGMSNGHSIWSSCNMIEVYFPRIFFPTGFGIGLSNLQNTKPSYDFIDGIIWLLGIFEERKTTIPTVYAGASSSFTILHFFTFSIFPFSTFCLISVIWRLLPFSMNLYLKLGSFWTSSSS